MANTIKHAVVRIDEMAGTKNSTFLKSAKFYNGETATAVDNAQLVVMDSKLDREVYKATAPTASTVRDDIYVTAGVVLFYDQTVTHYLPEWENAADKPILVYQAVPGGTFSATAEAFDGTPEVGKYVGYKDGSTKIVVQEAADAKTIGKIVLTESTGYGDGRYTYYMIDLCDAHV